MPFQKFAFNTLKDTKSQIFTPKKYDNTPPGVNTLIVFGHMLVMLIF